MECPSSGDTSFIFPKPDHLSGVAATRHLSASAENAGHTTSSSTTVRANSSACMMMTQLANAADLLAVAVHRLRDAAATILMASDVECAMC